MGEEHPNRGPVLRPQGQQGVARKESTYGIGPDLIIF